ncbi:MAG TPA: hypothetical protein VEX62_03050 [Candidatus Limnocylindrales bacterium]|nr:hypothetical protein [Candidatus Limnocylindrales bacterium]
MAEDAAPPSAGVVGRLTGSALVVLLVGVIGCGGTQATDSPGSVAPSGPAVTPDPGLPTALPSGDATTVFRALPDFPAANAFEVTGVTASADGGFVAVGFGAQPGHDYFGLRQGNVWRSPDGVTWQQTVEPQFVNVSPLMVAAMGSSDFMVGLLRTCPDFSDEPCTEPPEAGHGIWRSTSGGAWERLPIPLSMQNALSLDEVVVGSDRLAIPGTSGDESEAATLWTSPDGTTWTESTDLAGLDPIDTLAAGPPGFVAFGTVLAANEDFVTVHGATSADGVQFSPINVPAPINAAIVSSVAGTTGMSAVGYGDNEEFEVSATALYSADGTSWVAAADTDGSFGNSGMLEVLEVPSGYVALGFTPSADDFAVQDSTSWISSDGRSWRALAPIGDASAVLTSAASASPGVIVFTAIQEESDVDVTSTINAWFAPVEMLDTRAQ